MNVLEFQENLRRTGAYQTPHPLHLSAIDRLLGWTGMGYYYRLFSVIWRCSRKGRRGLLDDATWSGFSLQVLRAVESIGGTVTVSGFKPVAAESSPVVYVANHMSLLETFTIPVLSLSRGRHLTIVLKESLLRYPVFGHVMTAIRPVTVTRQNPREDLRCALKGSCAALARGDDVLIFPQSTRSTQVIPADFNSLGAKIAQRAGVPMVPLALKTDFHGIGMLIRDFGRIDRRRPVQFLFGDPIHVTGNGREEHRQVVEFIATTVREWGLGSRQVEPGGRK
jgi:1-acyl-sn-glycerol-3-phosphate acyltransferase